LGVWFLLLAGNPPRGGVQRFKLSLHGAAVSIAGIVGYIQEVDCPHWFAEVNRWIDDLASSDESNWSSSDRLHTFVYDPAPRVSRCAIGTLVGRDVLAAFVRLVSRAKRFDI
jgi:hypothetical protein